MNILVWVLFVIPLLPLIHATVQDWKSKEIDSILIVCVAMFGLTLKALFFPESIISSIAFSMFAFSIGLFLAEFKGWMIADALMFGAIGLCVQPIDYIRFFFIALVTLLTLNIVYKIVQRKKEKVEMHGIHAILLTFIAYTLSVI